MHERLLQPEPHCLSGSRGRQAQRGWPHVPEEKMNVLRMTGCYLTVVVLFCMPGHPSCVEGMLMGLDVGLWQTLSPLVPPCSLGLVLQKRS